jgi:hypothetical protein
MLHTVQKRGVIKIYVLSSWCESVAEGYHEGGVLGWLPLGPSIEGMGLRRAFARGIRGTPCITRGSFIKEGSNLAGTTSC